MEMEDEPKKRVLVVGNGFDLAIGRNTRYSDFYNSKYCPKRYPAPVIAWLNEKLGDRDDVKWYDLESELQNYAIEANKGERIKDFFSYLYSMNTVEIFTKEQADKKAKENQDIR